VPHEAIIDIAYVGAPEQIDNDMGIENHIISPFFACCSGVPTYAITTIVLRRRKIRENFSQWRRKVFIVGVKEAQNKYHTYITALTPQITSKDNGLLRKAESQLITCCKDDFFRAREFEQIHESFCECTLEKFAPKEALSVSSAKQQTCSPAKKSPTRPPAD
jgi:hypothetical protein